MRSAPSAERNKGPISDVLAKHAPFASAAERVCCLEIASGTGQHVAHFATRFPHVTFQPTEYAGGSAGPEEPAYGSLSPIFSSIVAHSGGMANVLPPCELDAAAASWSVETTSPGVQWDAVYACNICHISPYDVSEGLFAGAGRLLRPNGALFIYGPFMVDGQHTAPSNEAFDQRLRSQNAAWGVRDATVLASLAASHGLAMEAREEMPANNFILVFRKRTESG